MDGPRQLEYRQNQRSDDQSDHDPHYEQHDRFDRFGQSGDALVEFAPVKLGHARHDLGEIAGLVRVPVKYALLEKAHAGSVECQHEPFGTKGGFEAGKT